MNRVLLASAICAGLAVGVTQGQAPAPQKSPGYLIIRFDPTINVPVPQPGQGGNPEAPPPQGGVQIQPQPPIGIGQPPQPPTGTPPAPPEGGGTLQVQLTSMAGMAAIEVKRMTILGSGRPEIEHRWGKTRLPTPAANLSCIPVQMPSLAKRYEDTRKEMLKPANAENHLKLATWALAHGLLDDYVWNMEALAKLNAKEPAVGKIVAAFQKVQTDLKKPVSRDDPGISWNNRLRYSVKSSAHYTLIHNITGNAREVESRLGRLEATMRGFYYWFALKGTALPVPDRRLVCVLEDIPGEFRRMHQSFDAVPMVADGFLARRDNVVVFCSARLDESYDAISRYTRNLQQNGWDMDALLAGKWMPTDKVPIEESYKNQLVAVLQEAMRDESEQVTVSHEGTRQLLAATGLLPRTVTLPDWIQVGMPSFFETSRGAFWSGPGTPSWGYLAHFRMMEAQKRLEQPGVALERVLTDSYFRQSANGADREATMKARTMAWALVYYLAQNKLDNLMKYLTELSKLPRDMEFEEEVLLHCFARSFDLLDPNQPGGIDNDGLNRLGADWFRYINRTPFPASEVVEEAMRTYNDRRNQGGVSGGMTTSGPIGYPTMGNTGIGGIISSLPFPIQGGGQGGYRPPAGGQGGFRPPGGGQGGIRPPGGGQGGIRPPVGGQGGNRPRPGGRVGG